MLKKTFIIYTGIISLIALYNSIIFFVESATVLFSFSIIAELILIFLGIFIFSYSLFHNLNVKTLLLIVWWIPQIISVSNQSFNFYLRTYVNDIIYQGYILLKFGFGMGWENADGGYLNVSFNFLAIAAIIILLTIFSKEKFNNKEYINVEKQ